MHKPSVLGGNHSWATRKRVIGLLLVSIQARGNPRRSIKRIVTHRQVVKEVVMNGQHQEFVQRVGNERLAAVGCVFLLLNVIIRFNTLRPAGRKTRA